MRPQYVLITLAAWWAPAAVLFVGLMLIERRGPIIDPKDWIRCAAADGDNPAAKTCWVHIEAGPYCPNHDGSGRTVRSS